MEAAQFLRQKGYRCLGANKTFAGVQVDLVMRAPEGHFVLVEVKSKGAGDRGVLSPSQKQRLQRAQSLYAEWNGPTELLVLVQCAEETGGFLEVPIQE